MVVVGVIVLFVLNRDTATDVTNTNNVNKTTNQDVTVDESTFQPVISADGTYTLLQTAEPTVIAEITSYVFADGNALSVMPASMQALVLNETPVQHSTVVIDSETGITYTHYILSSAKDGSAFAVVHVIQQGKLYDFRGTDDYLNHLEKYIQFN